MNSRKSTGIDRGTPPSAVLYEEEERRRLLEGYEDYESDVTPPSNEHEEKSIRSVRPGRPTEYVSLENDTLRFRFKVYDCCFTELALIFVLDPEQFNVEPKKDTSFIATYRGEEYPVIYIGGPLHFKSFDLHQIIFIRDISKETIVNETKL